MNHNQENLNIESRLHYEYICLYRMCKVREFLVYFPECERIFENYNEQFNINVNELYEAYVSRYIKKNGLIMIMKYQKHVYNLHHEIYLPSKSDECIKKITKKVVKEYLENQIPEELMLMI